MNIYLHQRVENNRRGLNGRSEYIDLIEIEKIQDFTIKQLANFIYETYDKGTYFAVYNHRFTGRFIRLFYITVHDYNNFDLRPGGTIKRYCKID